MSGKLPGGGFVRDGGSSDMLARKRRGGRASRAQTEGRFVIVLVYLALLTGGAG